MMIRQMDLILKDLNLFFENVFRPEKITFFDWIFFKVISWFRRNVLKRFRNAPGSLKRGKAMRKKCRPNNFEDILLSGRCMTPGGSGDQHANNRKRLFSK